MPCLKNPVIFFLTCKADNFKVKHSLKIKFFIVFCLTLDGRDFAKRERPSALDFGEFRLTAGLAFKGWEPLKRLSFSISSPAKDQIERR
jgi:hypothetical protein